MQHSGYSGVSVVVLGGAGFLGSHLCEALLTGGASVTCVDSLITGRLENIDHIRKRVDFMHRDITHPIIVPGPVGFVFNLASPASPVDFEKWPIEILDTGSQGTRNALDLALMKGAKYIHASTSEVYGDPLINPQSEGYWGNVNPVGIRGVYDEGKRFGEALTMAYHRVHGLDTAIVRIFNTYGARMRLDDGRAVPAFFSAALANRPLPVHGDGLQTRSLAYVSDTIDGILRLGLAEYADPVNIGNPHEITILELAETIQRVVGKRPGIDFRPRPADDPMVRRPEISTARSVLGWEPVVDLETGLKSALNWFAR